MQRRKGTCSVTQLVAKMGTEPRPPDPCSNDASMLGFIPEGKQAEGVTATVTVLAWGLQFEHEYVRCISLLPLQSQPSPRHPPKAGLCREGPSPRYLCVSWAMNEPLHQGDLKGDWEDVKDFLSPSEECVSSPQVPWVPTGQEALY